MDPRTQNGTLYGSYGGMTGGYMPPMYGSIGGVQQYPGAEMYTQQAPIYQTQTFAQPQYVQAAPMQMGYATQEIQAPRTYMEEVTKTIQVPKTVMESHDIEYQAPRIEMETRTIQVNIPSWGPADIIDLGCPLCAARIAYPCGKQKDPSCWRRVLSANCMEKK